MGAIAASSELLTSHGFRHGFSLRHGGVSEPPFDSLNLGRSVGDDAQAVEVNHRRLAAAIGYTRLYEVSQVHAAEAHVVEPGDDPVAFRAREGDAIALGGGREGWGVGVRTADCVPILVADPQSGAVAAIHAGWRGIVAGVIGAGLARMDELAGGACRSRLVAAIGPHVRVGAFEVGDEVVAALAPLVPVDGIVVRGPGKPHVDLTAAVRFQLIEAGLHPERVDALAGCTFAEPSRFFSHRRDGARAGRHLAVIVSR
jgi:YfiH family protein